MNENYPKAYKLGYQNFYGYDFKVTPDVLIPRPETEQLVDAVLNLAGVPYLPGVKPSENKLGKNPKILEIGTGSGCIAITLTLKLPKAEIVATDLSEKALKIAKENYTRLVKNHTSASDPCQKNHTPDPRNHTNNILFLKADLLDGVDFTPNLLIANLPYVDEDWDWLDKAALATEPSEALYAEDGGLALIKKLIDEASVRKIPRLLLEADPCQHQAIINYAKDYELAETRGFSILFNLLSET